MTHIAISALAEGDEVVVRVKDKGIGIAPARLKQVFEAFAQGAQASDRALGGLGLGLTIVKNIVTLHGGEVEAHSAGVGRGCEFVVRLPRPMSLSDAAPAVTTVSPAPSKAKGLRVLLVDDNEDAAMLLSELLECEGHEVVVAHDGAAALKASLSFLPDVALLDIGLPEMDGYELAGHLRARFPTAALRMFAITGYGEEKDKARAKVAGFDEHFVKPVDIARLRLLLAARSAA